MIKKLIPIILLIVLCSGPNLIAQDKSLLSVESPWMVFNLANLFVNVNYSVPANINEFNAWSITKNMGESKLLIKLGYSPKILQYTHKRGPDKEYFKIQSLYSGSSISRWTSHDFDHSSVAAANYNIQVGSSINFYGDIRAAGFLGANYSASRYQYDFYNHSEYDVYTTWDYPELYRDEDRSYELQENVIKLSNQLSPVLGLSLFGYYHSFSVSVIYTDPIQVVFIAGHTISYEGLKKIMRHIAN